ncbi:ABC transporter ATP-binding protein [Saccharibacillus sacchari]|uniref:ABC transporter ATP-binding protein n=1 Tax=Saccharibacillus sacchari TaxID=456493 RepID=A0ACC6PGD8_9BACL
MWRYLKALKGVIFVQVLFSGLYALTIACIPYLQKMLFDQGFGSGTHALLGLAFLYIGCIAGSAVTQYISQVYEWKTAKGFNLRIKNDFFRAVARYPYRRFAGKSVGEYLSMLSNDVEMLETQYVDAIIDILKSINMLVVYGFFLFVFIDVRIAGVIVAASLVSVFIPKLMAGRLARLRLAYQEQLGRYTDKVKDLLDGFKRIDYVTRGAIGDQHAAILADTEQKHYRFGRFKTLANVTNSFVMDIVSLSAFFAVGYLYYRGQITVGTGIATFGYIESFIYPIKYILNDINSLNASKEAKKNLLALLEESESPLPCKTSFEQAIEFQQTRVALGDFRLEPFTYRFEKGKKYALIGPSGSGKSTVLNALMKYVPQSAGRIVIDGEDIEKLDLSRIVCCIHQHEPIFADDFLNNVSVFRSYPIGGLDKVSGRLQSGMLESLRSRTDAQAMSGGEKQMLAALRLMLADPCICVLDEPFAAMDARMTEQVQKLLMSLENKTIIMVTHKIDRRYLEQFDEILCMEKGRLIAAGTPEQIWGMDSYARLSG